jgi:hypothetical protein
MPKRASNLALNAGADAIIDSLARLQPCCPQWEEMTEADREQWRVDAAQSFVHAMSAIDMLGYQVMGPPSVPPLNHLTRSIIQAADRRRLLRHAREVKNG